MKDEIMKKIVAALSIVSVISGLIAIILRISTTSSGLFTMFIAEWLLGPLTLLALPLMRLPLSLVLNLYALPPKIWLIIYAIMVVLYSFFALGSDYNIAMTRDLPMAFRRNYVSIEGEAHSIRDTNSSQVVSIANKQFNLREADFNKVTRNNTYQINYLPNSRYVIDVIDENGRSLSRR